MNNGRIGVISSFVARAAGPWRVLALVALGSCGGGAEPPAPLDEQLTDLPNQPGGNPLVPAFAMLPYPSDLYLVPDATTPTGVRLEVPAEALPEGVSPDMLATHDGYTRAPAILAWLEGGVDPEGLPDLAASIEPGSPVLLVEEGTLRAVPVLVELDGTTDRLSRQVLILRPQIALAADTRYAVLLTDGLRRADGSAHVPVDAFRALRDGIPTDSPELEAQRATFPLVLQAADAFEVDHDDLLLAWTFRTRSEVGVVGPVLAMHDAVMEAALADWAPVSDRVEGANRLIEGQITVPDFLGPSGRIEIDGAGLPVVQGSRAVDFLVTIPETVVEPRPVVLFGHGFFSSKEETTWGSLQQSLQPWRMSTVSTDFIGFNEADAVRTIGALGSGIGGLGGVVDEQLQSHLHFTALARLVREQLADDVVEDRGEGTFHPLRADRVVYMGISNGGTQGSVIVAASPAIDTAALVVPGGGWSHLLQRAVQWNTLGGVLEQRYPDPVDLQVVLALAQNVLDPVDVLSYVDHLTGEPYPGRTPAKLTLHQAVGDSQVSNMVTEWVARAAGIPLVTPSARDVWGLDTVTAPPPGRQDLPAAMFVYDEGYPAGPEGNVPPSVDNGAHETIRDLTVYREQVGAFLEDGTIVQVCDGACDPE